MNVRDAIWKTMSRKTATRRQRATRVHGGDARGRGTLGENDGAILLMSWDTTPHVFSRKSMIERMKSMRSAMLDSDESSSEEEVEEKGRKLSPPRVDSPSRLEVPTAPAHSAAEQQRMGKAIQLFEEKERTLEAALARKGPCDLARSTTLIAEDYWHERAGLDLQRQTSGPGGALQGARKRTMLRQTPLEAAEGLAPLRRRGFAGVGTASRKIARLSLASADSVDTSDSRHHGAETPPPEAAPKQWSSFEAMRYAESFNLPMEHVKRLRSIFRTYDVSGDGHLDQEEFHLMLRSMLREKYPLAKEVPRELFQTADKSADGRVDFGEFVYWFTMHSFSEAVLLSPEQQRMRMLARSLELPVTEVERMKREFDRFDEDSSGEVEYEEFRKLVHILLRIPPGLDLPEKRLHAFWQEIDQDQSGAVDFEEFLAWYRRQNLTVNSYYAQVRGIAHENARRRVQMDELMHRPGQDAPDAMPKGKRGESGGAAWEEAQKRGTYVTQQLLQNKGTIYAANY